MTKDIKFNKDKLPSRHVTEGPERAPHRSYYYAMGMTEEELNNNPHAGSVFAYNASTKGKPDFKFGS